MCLISGRQSEPIAIAGSGRVPGLTPRRDSRRRAAAASIPFSIVQSCQIGPGRAWSIATSRSMPPRLTAGPRRGAVDVGVYAHVIERAGEDRHRDCAGPAAAADEPLVIATLPGGQAADNQPDDEKQRPDAHSDLRHPSLTGLAKVWHL